MNIYLLIAFGLIFIVMIILFGLVVRISQRVTVFTRGKNGVSLESAVKQLGDDYRDYTNRHADLVKIVDDINHRLMTSHRGFAITRFNAFEHTGGNQSFAIAILDEKGNGMVLSSLYSRERSNVFGKPIINFTSEVELTDEEKDVVKKAIASLGLKK